MATITEDYVSFETATLLKEKGMNKSCFKHYVQKNNDDGTSELVTVCTLQMAMKWLREVHKIGVFPSTYTHTIGSDITHSYGTAIIDLNTYELMTNDFIDRETYEEACEAAIKYCLENLI